MSDLLPSSRAEALPALTDTRIIEFSHRTMIAALESVGVKLLNLPSSRRITHLEIQPEINAFRVTYAGGAVRTVDDNQLAVVMIAYCIAARLPISRSAKKAVTLTERGVTLRFTTTLASPPWV